MGESPFESTTMEAPLFRLPTEPIKRTPNEFEFEWHHGEGMFANSSSASLETRT
jgi:hypothetical protein